MGTKACRTCKQILSLDDFYRHPKSADGHVYECKGCQTARARRWAAEHPQEHLEAMRRYAKTDKYKATRKALRDRKRDEIRAQRKDWYGRNREAISARRRERYQSDPEYRAESNRRARESAAKNRSHQQARLREKLYGLTAAEHEAMLQRQQGRCAICKSAAALSVDHDHETGQVRGLLCPRCNHGLGNFRDDAEFLASAIGYLAGARANIGDLS